jgi:hypothetical protein
LTKQASLEEIDKCIIQVVKEAKPENVEMLMEIVYKEFGFPGKMTHPRILHLEEDGKIRFKSNESLSIGGFVAYARSARAYWYWTTLILVSMTTLVIFTVPEDAVPFVYARYVLGLIFVLWEPGYVLVKALFPRKGLDSIERVALSFGMSLALVPLVGLLLNYSPWGIRLVSITFSLSALTVILATAAIVRGYLAQEK